MNLYRVDGGVARFGPGQELALDDEQVKRRAHNLDVLGRKGKRTLVRTRTAVEFKAGETVGVVELEKRLVDVLAPLGKVGDDASEAVKVAAEKAVQREEENRAAERTIARAAPSQRYAAAAKTAAPEPAGEPAA